MKLAANARTTLHKLCKDLLRFNDPTQSWGESDSYLEVLAWTRAVSAFLVVLLAFWGTGWLYQQIKLNSTQQYLEQCGKAVQNAEACARQ